MAAIEIVYAVPTICGPVTDFQKLTLSSNAITLGYYGFFAGLIAAGLVYFGFFYAGPKVYYYGLDKGWWS